MELKNAQITKSVGDINKFIDGFKEIRTVGVLCRVSCLKKGKDYLVDTCNCCVRYNCGYSQVEFQTNWTYEKSILGKHKLRETYNTNFHVFELEDDILKIIDKGKIITVKIEVDYENTKKENELD